jgi:hypothetical protein
VIADVLKAKPPGKQPALEGRSEAKMNDIREIHGPGLCEAKICQRERAGGDRNFQTAGDSVRIGDHRYHKECAPSDEEVAAATRS